MRGSWKGTCGLALVAALGIAPASIAAPITYFFQTGSVDLTFTTASTALGSGTIDLDGTFVDFDEPPVSPELTGFEFTATAQGPVMLNVAYAGYDTFTVDSLTVQPGPSYNTFFGFGSNPYTVTVGPINVIATATISDSNNVLNTITASFNFLTPSLTATVTINNAVNVVQTLELVGLTLGEIGPFFGATNTLVIKGDILFQGQVPEPSTAVLLGVGMTLLVAVARRVRP